jgi:aspartate ammonia-lyase
VGTVTALTPFIGYANSAGIVKQALATSDCVPDLVVAQGLLTVEQVQQLLDPHRLTELHSTPPGAAILEPSDCP